MRQYITKCMNILNAQGIVAFNRRFCAHIKRKIADKKYFKQEVLPSLCAVGEDNDRVRQFPPFFSIIVPLYNTPISYLIDMVRSCCSQVYRNWELWIVDGSDSDHEMIKEYMEKLVVSDRRIRYQKIEKNRGIAENTNIALKMAKGEYFLLLDHDDMLHPRALYEYAEVIQRQEADFVYCDEMVFRGKIKNIIAFHFKPDFAIDNLRGNNYICHLAAFSRNLYEKAGGMRKEYDGAQDYDLILRLAEQAENIIHIPRILYFWRSHGQSVAGNMDAKKYAVMAGKRAVESHLERCHLTGTVHCSEAAPGFYQVKYDILESAMISIVVWKKEGMSGFGEWLAAVTRKLSYPNYEFVVICSAEEGAEFVWEQETKHLVRVASQSGNGEEGARMLNKTAKVCRGEYLFFLDSEIEILSSDCLEQMLMYVQREDVGCAGAKIYHENGTVYHGGIVFDRKKRHYNYFHYGYGKDDVGYMGRLVYAQNFMAVSTDCMLISKETFWRVGGFSEMYSIKNCGIDLCRKLRQINQLIVWTPHAEMIRHDRGARDGRMKYTDISRFRVLEDVDEMEDPYYNKNLECQFGAIIAKG
jgi:Glycosyltransferases, probably involved in cell wall biogenesis